MKIISIIFTVLMALLSIAAGAAKLMQVPEEMAFLVGFGLNNTAIFIFGIIQIVGAILLAIPKSKIYGSIIVAIAFLLSAALVFASGNINFGAISTLPVIISSLIFYQTLKITGENATQENGL